MFDFRELMMGKTEIVAAPDQIHPRLQSEDPTGRMTRFARQARQPFSKGAIQTLDKSRVEDHPTPRTVKQLLRVSQQTVSHPTGNLHHPFFLRPLDHGTNRQLWPDLQARSPDSFCKLHLLTERPADAAWVG